ncbi:DNA glycosylase AlkZ-like family protein [Sciscionella sediminilitoris]|uniref:DNA glycosylase AlkZ-like family protein n=1 Tax=Sciscionella sediminilitoris TaxID=1445613 RepID=UPI0004DF5E4A|nr:crosslink repair DNA glycosylase YcaQ family protein [Sciscionella sp. SE31]
MELSRDEVLRYRMHRQGLYRLEEEPAILDLGLQHTGTSVAQALAARTPRTGWDHPGLTLAWTYRGAPHLHWDADLGPLATALSPRTEDGAAARLAWSKPQVERCGMPASEAIGTVASVAAEVITGPMTKGAASTAITERIPRGLGYDCRGCRAFHVYEQLMRVAMLPAGIVLDRQAPKVVLQPGNLRRPKRKPDPAAAIRTYLRFLGPATIQEAVAFLNSTERELTPVWPRDLLECTVDGAPAFLAEKPGELPGEPIVRLLPPMDPYLQSRNRAFLVPDALARKRLWRILGNPGALLVDGEILGAVRQKASGRKLEVTVEAFGHVSAPVRADTEAEAQRLAEARDMRAVTVHWLD